MQVSEHASLALVAASVADANGFPNTAEALIELAMLAEQSRGGLSGERVGIVNKADLSNSLRKILHGANY